MLVPQSSLRRREVSRRAGKRSPVRVALILPLGVFLFALFVACSPETSNGNGGDGGSGGSNGSSGASGGGSNGGSGSGASSGGRGGSSSGSGSSGASGSGSSTGGSSGAGSSGASSGGSSGGADGGASSSSGATDASGDAVVCTNTDKSILTIDSKGWVDRMCNVYNLQGAWYCFADTYGAPEDNCTKGTTPFSTASPGPGMCLSGTVPASTSAYVGMGLSLNDSGGMSPVKSAYNATMNHIIGFTVTIAGTTGGGELRIGYPGADQQTNPTDPAPFVSAAGPASGGTTDIQALFSQAVVPSSWMVPNKGATVDPTAIYDIQMEIAGGTTAATYNFCVTDIKPIFSGDAGSSTCGTYGKVCGSQDVVVDVGNYAVQNNISNNGTGQCVQPTCSGGNPGFTATFPNGSFGNGGNSPSSYPSVIYGWAAGTFYPGSPLPKQLSGITSANSTWQYSVPGGSYDAAYDIWLGSGTSGTPGLELMIWMGYSGAQPAGSDTKKTFALGGVTYEVWTGQVNSWKYIAYQSKSPSASGSANFDLNSFFKDAEGEGVGLTSSWYLWGIQAGFEVYNASGTLTTTSFSASVQ